MKITIVPVSHPRPEANYAFCETRFGECLLAHADEAICWLAFISDRETALAELTEYWGEPNLRENITEVQQIANLIFSKLAAINGEFVVMMSGTVFQESVWRTLCDVPFSSVISYGQLASKNGTPASIRAAGSAIGKNNVSYLVPCHRIVRSDGSIGNYRWGSAVKKLLIEWEKQVRI